MGNGKDKLSDEVDFDATVPGEVETDATGKNVLIREKDVVDDTSELRLLEELSLEDDESGETEKEEEFDPYNSGSFDMSESPSWKSRSRK